MNAENCIEEQDKIFGFNKTMNNANEMIYPNEAYAIVGAAMEVQNELGCGFAELVYHEALNIELGLRNIPYKTEKLITIAYKGHVLERTYKADLLCFDKIIVELKAVEKLKAEHTSQLLNYLKATNMPLGVLINFGEKPLKFKLVPNYINANS